MWIFPTFWIKHFAGFDLIVSFFEVMSLNSGRQLNLSSLQQVVNEETKPEFLRRLDAVYWDARQMEENFAHYGGKVI